MKLGFINDEELIILSYNGEVVLYNYEKTHETVFCNSNFIDFTHFNKNIFVSSDYGEIAHFLIK
jgi:hypothetical protein